MLAPPRAALADDAPRYVGAAACASCHVPETERWRQSHHAKAMQAPIAQTVLGDFSDARFAADDRTTEFVHNGDSYTISTAGPDGTPHEYRVAYAFGVYPLQQYLLPLAGGKLQAFGLAWDARPADQGGQRWFSLYPDQHLRAGDPLHWTGRDQTWNYQCAACHSTDLRKRYDLANDTYATTWSDVNVACEACHGPASRHVAWAATPDATDPRKGLANWLRPTGSGRWEMTQETGIAHRTEKLASAELDTCAACHSRRKVIADAPMSGTTFLDSHLPALLEPGLYHADGQIDGEVFEYGSFLQSRMYAAGVACSDCHEPHSLDLKAAGNALCAQCHLPARFDAEAHTHHAVGSPGARCVNCHMPAKTYMVVDPRRDHSFRVPRPDLSLAIGTPNACNQCHTGKSAKWAADAVDGWFPHGRQSTWHYGLALHAGRTDAADAERQLDRLILDRAQPAIARASALSLLRRYLSPSSAPAVRAAANDADPLVRAAAPRAVPPSLVSELAPDFIPLFSDPVAAVRVEAARAFAGLDPQLLPPAQRTVFAAAYRELVAAELVDADRPEAHLNLGLLDLARRLPAEAEAEYRTALRLDPRFVPAMANLADLDRLRGQDDAGEALLRQALAIEPTNADIQYALGLLLIRRHNNRQAVLHLREASERAPDNAHYGFVLALALQSTGSAQEAKALLERLAQSHPADREVLSELLVLAQNEGQRERAARYAHALLALDPGNPQLTRLLETLEGRAPQ
jgi:Flp pilus assembly protein TadD